MNKSIFCLSIVYYDKLITKLFLDFITKSELLDLFIIENKSKNNLDELIFKYLDEKKVSKYFLFEKNISNNAVDLILLREKFHLDEYKYILYTDGDLICKDDNWLEEEKEILENDEVFCCAVDLELTNLPIMVFPESKNWVKPARKYKNFKVGRTGSHLLLFKKEKFIEFLQYQQSNNYFWVDSTLWNFCVLKNLKWARTSIAKAYHLTWDLYYEGSPYLKEKKSWNVWNHSEISNYKTFYNSKQFCLNTIEEFNIFKSKK